MGENHFASLPAAVYGGVLFMAAVAYYVLQQRIILVQGRDSPLKAAIGGDWKGKVSPVFYLVAIAVAFYLPAISLGLYVLVAVLWLVPDRRIERHLAANH
jgi:uncharacterized membrane protein